MLCLYADLNQINNLHIASAYSVTARKLNITLRIRLPEEVRGIYWTAYTAGSDYGRKLLDYALETGLNTIVIDLKMDNGALAFEPYNKNLQDYVMSKPAIKDLDNLLLQLGRENIYRIARITVMRDSKFSLTNPNLAVKYTNSNPTSPAGELWRDDTGAHWLDPSAQEVIDYALTLGREAYKQGFDEIQYDYMRFPSDGNLAIINYPIYDKTKTKIEVMQDFFKQVGETLHTENIPVSFDLFGMTSVSTSGYGIGQRLIDVYTYADYISPMFYPSNGGVLWMLFGISLEYVRGIALFVVLQLFRLVSQQSSIFIKDKKKKARS